MSPDSISIFVLTAATAPAPATLPDLLDYYEARRDQLIMDLRYIDGQLIRHGRLKHETLPQRIR